MNKSSSANTLYTHFHKRTVNLPKNYFYLHPPSLFYTKIKQFLTYHISKQEHNPKIKYAMCVVCALTEQSNGYL